MAIVVGASYNVVSGTATAPEVISGNAGDGVLISGEAYDNQISGVFIGTDINGENALPNAGDGVAVNSAACGNFIGLAGSRANVISGNTGNGVSLTGVRRPIQNFVENDLIGIDAGGTPRWATARMACWSPARPPATSSATRPPATTT